MADRIPLALLPGLLTDRALWAHQIEALEDIAESRVADFSTQDSVAGMARSLLDTKARLDTPEQTERRVAFIEQARTGTFKGVTRRALEMYVHPDRIADQALAGAVLAMTGRVGRDTFFSQQAAVMGRPDSLPGLSEISCPTLVLCGRQDGPTPLDCHEEIARAIPNASLVVIEDCGHLSPMERPEEVSHALRGWLAAW